MKKKIMSVFLCLIMLFAYVPAGMADETNSLPQTPKAYAVSEYARYAARMAVGEEHLVLIKADGTLAVGGSNTNRQFDVPVELNGAVVKSVAAGIWHTLALTEDGRVYAWGNAITNDGTGTVPITIPDQVQVVQGNIKLIAAGDTMSAVVTNDNKVIVWGRTINNLSQVPEGLGNIVAMAISGNVALSLNDQGNLSVWGHNDCNTIPEDLNGNVLAVATGTFHWLALKKDGTVSINGPSSQIRNCQNIANQTGVKAIAGGWQSANALLADGSVKGWGRTSLGTASDGVELIPASAGIRAFAAAVSAGPPPVCAMQGDGSLVVAAPSSFTKEPIPDGFNFLTLSGNNAGLSGLVVSGYDLDPAFNVATENYTVNVPNEVSSVEVTATTAEGGATLKINGTATAGGTAQTVDNLAVGDNPVAVEVTAADGATIKIYTITIKRAAVSQGNDAALSSLAVAGYGLDKTFNAAVYAYTVNVPNEVSSVEITAITADTAATLKIDGTAITSGSMQMVDNLAVGENTVVVEVTAAGGTTVKTYTLTINRAEAANSLPQTPAAYAASDYAKYNDRIAAGGQHAVAVLQEGTVEVWGDNTNGQLEIIPQATGVKALAAGQYHTLALREDGTIAAWGRNASGQCNVPAELAGKTIKAITANSSTSAALTEDNRIYVWGQYNGVLVRANDLVKIAMNNTYLLALATDGTVEAWKYSDLSSIEVPEGFSGDVVDIKAGSTQALALKKDGSVAGWNDSYLPAGLAGVRSIMAGRNFSAAIYQDGTVTTWGVDNSGFGYLSVPSDLHPAVALTAGLYDMYALQSDGTMVSWGRNNYGQGDVPEDLNLYSAVSTNDRLVNLVVEGLDDTGLFIYPEFSCNQTAGVVEVASDIAKVRITPQAYSSTAALTINGDTVSSGEVTEITLNVGDNPIEIIVTAAGGSQRIYTLYVKRAGAGDVLPLLPQTPQAYQESVYAVYSRRLGANSQSVLAVKNDGTVVAWGQGQVTNIPPDVVDIKAVAVGPRHSLALKNDGTIVAWGYNDYGQCNVPADLSDVVDICIVGSSSIVLQANGTIRAWGQNQWDECNIPETLSGVVDIQGGNRHVLALKADGTVTAWGDNYFLQSNVPASLDHVVAVAAGFRQSVALKDDGTIVIWGAEDTKYAIGNLNQRNIKGITVGSGYVATLKMDGSVVAWGADMKPVLSIPVEQDKKTLAIGGYGQDNLVCLYEDGTVKVWAKELRYGIADTPTGLNLFVDDIPYSGAAPDIPQTPADYAASDYVQAAAKFGRTEVGSAILNMDGTVKVIPYSSNDYFGLAQVPEGLNNVTAIATSFRNIMALKEDGTIVVWGLNDDGQCQVPETVQGITAICATKNMNDCCLALKNDGTLIAWGNNAYGQCQVPDGLNDVTAIAAGYDHFLALRENGTVVAWGDNTYGQCNVPEGLNDVARVFAEYDYSMALKNDGTVVAWGSNCGLNSTVYNGQCDVPEGLNGVVDISLSGTSCIALKNNGTVVVWGRNYYGSRHVPPGLHDVAAVNFGTGGAIVIKIDGTVECWGHLNEFDDEILTGLSNVLTVVGDYIVFRDGTIKFYGRAPAGNDAVNAMLNGLNVLSGHYFVIDKVELLNPSGNSISTVPGLGGYRIQAGIDNNYASPTNGLSIIQVRGGSGATSTGGGQVLGCVGLSGEIPVTGSTVSSDFTMPAGIGGEAYVDVFVWDGWISMVPRAAANHNLSFTITE